MTSFGSGRLDATRLRRRARAFWHDQSGATAVEFGLIALPFFMMILAMLDVGVYMFAERAAKAGVMEFTRQVRTGRLADNLNTAQIKKCICASAYMSMFKCEDVKINMTKVSAFGPPGQPPRDETTNAVDDSGFSLSQPKAGEIVNVAAYVPWTRITPMGQPPNTFVSGNEYLIVARSSFRTEPFNDSDIAFNNNQAHKNWVKEEQRKARVRKRRTERGQDIRDQDRENPNSPNGLCQPY